MGLENPVYRPRLGTGKAAGNRLPQEGEKASSTGDRMNNKISRRDMLRQVGMAGATGVLLTGPGTSLFAAQSPEKQEEQREKSSLELLKEHEDYVAVLEAGEMLIHFDRRYGSISSITRKGDPMETNYIGNEINTPGVDPSDSRWTGDIVSTVWELTNDDWKHARLGQNDVLHMSGKWRREFTGQVRRQSANELWRQRRESSI